MVWQESCHTTRTNNEASRLLIVQPPFLLHEEGEPIAELSKRSGNLDQQSPPAEEGSSKLFLFL